MARVRKAIKELAEEMKSEFANYDRGPGEYPTVIMRLLASLPGGEELEDFGYEPFNLGWREIEMITQVLDTIQDKDDVENLSRLLLEEEED